MVPSKQKWQSDTIKYKVHSILMGDVDDPDLLVAEPIYKWQQTDAGKWVMENSITEPMWTRNPGYWGHNYIIYAYFTSQQLTYYKLKFE
jgi:hypothetical protein